MAVNICFNASKGERYTPSSGFKKLARRLRSTYRISDNRDPVCDDTFYEVKLMVFGGPTADFTGAECDSIDRFISGGGSCLFLPLSKDARGESEPPNLNFLLESHGIACNDDAVVRTVYRRGYAHPNEVCVTDGIVNRGISKAVNAEKQDQEAKVSFAYPRGCTLNVQQPGVAILSSGYVSFPVNRPVAAISESSRSGGRICALGSCEMWADNWLEKENNWGLCEILFSWLTGKDVFELNNIDSAEPDISDLAHIPDTVSIANQPKSCLQESAELPPDFTSLFDEELFKFDTNLIPEAVALRKRLNMGEKPLDLITPQFELVQPPLSPAVFPAILREMSAPALELFDLDQEFAAERLRLAQLSNKCGAEDIAYYMLEASQIVAHNEALGLGGQDKSLDAKQCIFHMMSQIVNWRKLHHSQGDQMMGGMQDMGMMGMDLSLIHI
eukprot:TRINITY_DN6201_c0_g1_i4.p1 TRINITY_DN6201_c0_g1~~TRINITY_DN6201_c0_g1_i4.p1  ORF type:complete len:443 (+),score=128.94 TRINITY_DN6201_c0_g1_i4:248-1576(+)